MSYDQTSKLIEAAFKGDLEKVKKHLPHANPKANASEALNAAASGGNVDVVRLLIPVSTPSARYNQALKTAARAGHSDIVEELIPFASLRHRQEALREAAVGGNLQSVQVLCKSFAEDKSIAMCEAIRHQHIDVIDFLSHQRLDFESRELDLLGYSVRIFLGKVRGPGPLIIKVLQSLPPSTHFSVMLEAINNTNNPLYIEAVYPGCDPQALLNHYQKPGFARVPMSKHLRALIDRDVSRAHLQEEVASHLNTQTPAPDVIAPARPKSRKI